MSIFDNFRFKSSVPKGYVKTNVEFTDEEREAIAVSLTELADIIAIAHEKEPQGTKLYVHPKLEDAWVAKGLAEYVKILMIQLEDCDSNQERSLMDKALRAQAKAYAVHNLPVYLFQLALMVELSGDVRDAKDLFRQFLQAQRDFTADNVDTVILNEAGFDSSEMVAAAIDKAR